MSNKLTEEDLLQFTKDWDEAMIRNDADDIGRYMSDDWVIVGADGITPKDKFLSSIRSGVLTHHTMSTDKTRVKIYGNTGVISALGTSAGHFNALPFQFYEWSTNVFLYNEKRWSCVVTMLAEARKD